MDIKQFEKENKDNIYLFNQGTYYRAFEMLGAHPCTEGGAEGTRFSVWVPGAKAVSVEGDFNGWDGNKDMLSPVASSGIWTGFVPGAREGQSYKFLIKTDKGRFLHKSDPYAFWSEVRPRSASVIRRLDYSWNDAAWMERRRNSDHFAAPKNIYEVHLGSWKRHTDQQGEAAERCERGIRGGRNSAR